MESKFKELKKIDSKNLIPIVSRFFFQYLNYAINYEIGINKMALSKTRKKFQLKQIISLPNHTQDLRAEQEEIVIGAAEKVIQN